VDAGAVDTFTGRVAAGYRAATGLEAQIFIGSPGAGVGAVAEAAGA
jgi:hypothetical protein